MLLWIFRKFFVYMKTIPKKSSYYLEISVYIHQNLYYFDTGIQDRNIQSLKIKEKVINHATFMYYHKYY